MVSDQTDVKGNRGRCEVRVVDCLTLKSCFRMQAVISSSQQPLNSACELFRLPPRTKSSRCLAISVDQELGKVPADGPAAPKAEQSGLLLFKKAEEGVGGRAVDVDFGEKRKSDAEAHFAKSGDFRRRTRLLGAKLVRRKAEDGKSPAPVCPIKALQRGVLWCKSALAGSIDDQQHLPTELGKVLLMPIQKRRGKVVNGLVIHIENQCGGRMPCAPCLRLKRMPLEEPQEQAYNPIRSGRLSDGW
jgi:hypothetical protein